MKNRVLVNPSFATEIEKTNGAVIPSPALQTGNATGNGFISQNFGSSSLSALQQVRDANFAFTFLEENDRTIFF